MIFRILLHHRNKTCGLINKVCDKILPFLDRLFNFSPLCVVLNYKVQTISNIWDQNICGIISIGILLHYTIQPNLTNNISEELKNVICILNILCRIGTFDKNNSMMWIHKKLKRVHSVMVVHPSHFSCNPSLSKSVWRLKHKLEAPHTLSQCNRHQSHMALAA